MVMKLHAMIVLNCVEGIWWIFRYCYFNKERGNVGYRTDCFKSLLYCLTTQRTAKTVIPRDEVHSEHSRIRQGSRFKPYPVPFLSPLSLGALGS